MMEAAIAEVALFASSHLRPKLWGGADADGVGVPGAELCPPAPPPPPPPPSSISSLSHIHGRKGTEDGEGTAGNVSVAARMRAQSVVRTMLSLFSMSTWPPIVCLMLHLMLEYANIP